MAGIVENKLYRVGNAAKLLLALCKDITSAVAGEDLLINTRAIYRFGRKIDLEQTQLQSALQSLRNAGYLEKSDKEKYLITPKGIKRAQLLQIQKETELPKGWDSQWRIVIFDIPESKRKERNIFRAFLKRKKFIRLQNSVFVCPYANFEELNIIRHQFKIEKFVNFLISKTVSQDDDSLLRKHFKLDKS